MDGQMFVQVLCKKMRNNNVVFWIRVFENEICFEQINVLFFTNLKYIVNYFFVCNLHTLS
jgi:hypothetical protein